MASARRRLLLSEHDPVRMREAHNNLDDAVLKTEGRIKNTEERLDDLEDDVSSIEAAAEAITNADDNHNLNAAFDNAEANAALDALGTKINAILAALRALA